jgi:hypothetical protein
MKKILIPATLLLIAACAQPFLKDKSNDKNSPAITMNYTPPVQQENTRHPYKESFSALNIPDEMKQSFRLNPKASQVVVGNSGTMILVPDNAFTDANGNAVEGKVKMEVVEGIKDADIIKMNLGTMSDQGPLETGGMVYINAFAENGDTLQLAKEKQLEIEIPTDNKKRGMKLWTGITHEDGSVSWADPQPLKEELRQIPLEALEEKAEAKEEKKVVKKGEPRIAVKTGFIYDAVSDSGWWVGANGQWVSGSYVQGDSNLVLTTSKNGLVTGAINLADKKFENTNIATAEFRSRLPFIRQACDSRVMLCYTNNPKRSLWKSDNAAADSLEKTGCALAKLFRSFADLKQEKINPSDANTVAALNAAREKAIENYSDKVREQQKMYAGYSFGMKKLGWANVDCLANGGTPMFFNVHVDGGDNGNVTATLIVPARNLFINAYKRPNGDYSFTHGEFEQNPAYPQGEVAYVVAKSGKEGNFKFDVKKIILGDNRIENVSLHAGTEDALSLALGNEPPKKDAPEKAIDDWNTRSIRSGGGCLCGDTEGTMLWGAMKFK